MEFPALSETQVTAIQTLLSFNELKPKWMAKITTHQQRFSGIVRTFLLHPNPVPEIPDPGPVDPERFRLKKQSSLSLVSRLASNFPVNSYPEMSATSPAPESGQEQDLNFFFRHLEEKGYSSLVEKIKRFGHHFPPEIMEIRSPGLIEQIIDFYLLCSHKCPAGAQTTLQFLPSTFSVNLAILVNSTAKNLDHVHAYELIEETKIIIAQLAYLINMDLPSAIKLIERNPNFADAIAEIKTAFGCEMQTICIRLEQHYNDHLQTGLQPADVALSTQISVEIARALLTDIGTLNVGIIPVLSDIFLAHDTPHYNQEAHLAHALQLLHRSPGIRAEFEKIKKPFTLKTNATETICASLSLTPDAQIQDYHVRLTILVAFLSRLRQGEDDSCFAASLAIEMLSTHLGCCFKDWRELMLKGKLTRHIENNKKNIHFLTRIHDENLKNEIVFDRKGNLYRNELVVATLWQAPGVQAACNAAGIEDRKKMILSTIKEMVKIKKDSCYVISIEEFLRILCNRFSEKTLQNRSRSEKIFEKACFGFSSQTAQPVLKVWENAIARMAEIEEGGMIKRAIRHSIMTSLQQTLHEAKVPPNPFLSRFFTLMNQNLCEDIRLFYDPSIERKDKNGTKCKKSGFVLYHRKKRIADEDSFRDFILSILLKTITELKNKSSPLEKKELETIAGLFVSDIDKPKFMSYLLVRFNPVNKKSVKRILGERGSFSEELSFTPWITISGHNSKAVLKVYFEAAQPIPYERIISGGAEEALTNIIDMCKRMSNEEKALFLENPNKLKPFCILGKHRLPFMAGNPSLAKAWQQDSPTSEWIREYVIRPGTEIANTRVDLTTKLNILCEIEKGGLSSFLSRAQAAGLIRQIGKISDSTTLKEYRQAIAELCLEKIRPQNRHPFLLKLDTLICQSLNEELKTKLENSAVRFADTSWCKGIHDLHFCFAVNPCTGALQLWECYANGTHLVAVDEKYWLYNQQWEFLTIPTEWAPDDPINIRSSYA